MRAQNTSSSKPENRPVIFDYRTIPAFISSMLTWKRMVEPNFSIRRACKESGCSPALISLLIRGKRQLTRERVPLIANLLSLNKEETVFLDRWVATQRNPQHFLRENKLATQKRQKRAEPENHLLQNWLNLYVKDACELKGLRIESKEIQRVLGDIATTEQIERSLSYLLRNGVLRKTLGGKIVKNNEISTTTDGIPYQKIRQFHKKALQIAARGLDIYPIEQRRANAMIMALDEAGFRELNDLLRDFHERLISFLEEHPEPGKRLYQVVINLSPVGGQSEK